MKDMFKKKIVKGDFIVYHTPSSVDKMAVGLVLEEGKKLKIIGTGYNNKPNSKTSLLSSPTAVVISENSLPPSLVKKLKKFES